eukprot:144103_1
MNFFAAFCLLFVSTTFTESLAVSCNYIDLGFNVIQPTNKCVIGQHKDNGDSPMSMAHFCVSNNQIESRIWYNNMDCSGNEYVVSKTFDCNSNDTFVECNCQSIQQQPKQECSTVTDTRYVKRKDGSCDRSKVVEFRRYLINELQTCPDTFIDANCLQRTCNHSDIGVQSSLGSAQYWLQKLLIFKSASLHS